MSSVVEQILENQDSVDFIEALAITFKDINAEKIIELLPKLIAYVQKYKKLSGDQKKALIIKFLNIIIDKTDGPGDDEIFDPILKRLVPVLIDTFIKIDNKELSFKKPKCLGKCFACCL
tara:strand:+ start:232 stop:588 length:357 start_codon:yes stop_codon:yes gene_type:complete